MLKIGSHVGMKGKEMLLGSAREAHSYGANIFMVFSGAPQNTKRKPLEELNLSAAADYMKEHGIAAPILHAPYIINLANTVNAETYRLAADFLSLEIERTAAMSGSVLVLHPGSHVGAGSQAGINRIAEGLNEVLHTDTPCSVALETMSGKGSEIGRSLEELAAVFDKVSCSDKLSICLDTCHMHDAGYDIIHGFDQILDQINHLVGIDKVSVIHINDSKNPCGAAKDRHANIGEGFIGLDALKRVVHHPLLADVPKILETPYIPSPENPAKTLPPYKEEILLLRG